MDTLLSKKIEWLHTLKKNIPFFLKKIQSKKYGFFSYSLSGDIYDEKNKWGLGNTVFAIKIYYTLGLLDNLPKKEKRILSDFIKSFQNTDGSFHDPIIKNGLFLANIISSFKGLESYKNQIIRAETRQSLSALKLLNEKPILEYQNFPQTEKDILNYIEKLDWKKPWGAGSHFSHLLFFLHNSNLKNKNKLIDFSINQINRIQNSRDGSWYKGKPNPQQKINGAMKIITGLVAAEKYSFNYSKKLIDLCLSEKNNRHACDNFNIVYVLKYANAINKSNYRYDEIVDFCYNRLETYHNY
ncbi:MAG: hypothetical protein M0P97_00765 [Candidatus Moranbacteria bacterium]|jgi:hypothetical protein|nr:hypothetical protein [Candidatus Moranbacteria bacterium]